MGRNMVQIYRLNTSDHHQNVTYDTQQKRLSWWTLDLRSTLVRPNMTLVRPKPWLVRPKWILDRTKYGKIYKFRTTQFCVRPKSK